MTDQFLDDIRRNRNNAQILEHWDQIMLPDCWLVAGSLFQTVWNLVEGKSPEADIRDYDLFYHDQSDLGAEGERLVQQRVTGLFADLGVAVEVINQARVHLWYEDYFGFPCPQLQNSQDGIDRFLILETCVGIRPNEIYAPNGLQVIYQGTLSMNPLTPHLELYRKKVESYRSRWGWLRSQP